VEIYEDLLSLASRMTTIPDSQLLEKAAFALMPSDVRILRQVEKYAGEAVIVEDVVEGLGLEKNQNIAVGRALAKLGYKRTMMSFDAKVYPLWTKDCKYPRFCLDRILRRRRNLKLLQELASEISKERGAGSKFWGANAPRPPIPPRRELFPLRALITHKLD
jgi:hypothetical protein